MESTRIVVLPGLNGTDLLLRRFVEMAPANYTAIVIPLPGDRDDSYESLCDVLSTRLRELGPCHVIAESFSGPIGILLAHRHPETIVRLTLVASFAVTPVPWFAQWLPWSLILRFPMPMVVARYLFVGSNNRIATELKNAVRQTSPGSLVRRFRCLMNVNVCKQLAELRCAVRYIRPKHDRLVSKSAVDRIVRVNPSVTVRELDGPHLLLQTRPQEAWAAILDSDRSLTYK